MVNKCFGNGSVEKIIQNNLNKRCCQSQPLSRLCIGYVLTIKRKRKKKVRHLMIFEMMFVRNFRHRSSFVNWQQIFVTKSIPLLQDQQKHNDIL